MGRTERRAAARWTFDAKTERWTAVKTTRGTALAQEPGFEWRSDGTLASKRAY